MPQLLLNKSLGKTLTLFFYTFFYIFFTFFQILPALRSFCLFCGLGIFIIYLLQSTWFVAWMVLDQVERNLINFSNN